MNMDSIKSTADLLITINMLYDMLKGKFDFDPDGWSIFQSDHFLDEWPEDMVTYANRNSGLIVDRNRTLLCHFARDTQNYARFPKVMDDIPVYREYMGAVFPDITVTWDMDIEMQESILLANQLYAAVLAVYGVRLVANTRCGSKSSQRCFRHIPRNVTCASGFLGCPIASNIGETAAYINKILLLRPDKLIIYGKEDPAVTEQSQVQICV